VRSQVSSARLKIKKFVERRSKRAFRKAPSGS
jgi:hypothetical protein